MRERAPHTSNRPFSILRIFVVNLYEKLVHVAVVFVFVVFVVVVAVRQP